MGRQFNHLDFIAQFTTDIRHISGQNNVVADAPFRRIRHRTTIFRCTGHSTHKRRRTPNTSAIEHRPTASEATHSRNYGRHLLRYLCRKPSAVHSRAITITSVPVSPQSVAPRHKCNGKAGRTAFRAARRTEGLPNVGTGLSSLPTLQSLRPHSYPLARFHAAGSPFSSHSRRPYRTASNVSLLHILSHCSRRLHTTARSHPYPGHHDRHWHALSWPAGSPVSVVQRRSPPTRDVSLSPNSSTSWPNYVVINFLARPLITLQPMDSWKDSTERWKQPSCAKPTYIGQNNFPSSSSASAHHSKRIYKRQ
jgi:hypothetical protein